MEENKNGNKPNKHKKFYKHFNNKNKDNKPKEQNNANNQQQNQSANNVQNKPNNVVNNKPNNQNQQNKPVANNQVQNNKPANTEANNLTQEEILSNEAIAQLIRDDKPVDGKRVINRRALIIYYKQDNIVNTLDDYIHVVYNSKRLKYLVAYLDERLVYETKKKLIMSKGIKDVIDSKFDLETIEVKADE